MVVTLHTQWDKVLIINLYNDMEHQHSLKQVIHQLWRRACMRSGAIRLEHTIWLSDFNLHHPLWDKEHNSHLFMRPNLEKSQVLIDAAAELNMQMTLPKDTPKLQALVTRNYMWLDNIFLSTLLTNTLTCCCMLPGEPPMIMDHIPIVTELDIGVDTQIIMPCPNLRRADWKKVREELAPMLEQLESGEDVESASGFSHEGLTHMIKGVIETVTPNSNLPPHQKCWWSLELMAKCTEVCRLTCREYGRRSEPDDPVHQKHRGKKGIWADAQVHQEATLGRLSHLGQQEVSIDGTPVCIR